MALIHGELTHQIIGAFFEVHDELGYGLVESVYKRALAVELEARGISCAREVPFTVFYKKRAVGLYKEKKKKKTTPKKDAPALNH